MHIVVMPRHRRAPAALVNHVITPREQERLGPNYTPVGAARGAGASRSSLEPVYVTGENAGNDEEGP